MFARTFREVGPRSRDRNAYWERTAMEFGRLEGSSEGVDDESAKGKDQRESDHC
jgi:hypothetical protein